MKTQLPEPPQAAVDCADCGRAILPGEPRHRDVIKRHDGSILMIRIHHAGLPTIRLIVRGLS